MSSEVSGFAVTATWQTLHSSPGADKNACLWQTSPGYAAAAVEFEHGSVRVQLSAATAVYFTYNPLLHIGVGGCFLPADSDVPLGTGYQVDILDQRDQLLVRCRAKVAAKQDRWVGLRFIGLDRATLQLLRAEIAKLSTTNTL